MKKIITTLVFILSVISSGYACGGYNKSGGMMGDRFLNHVFKALSYIEIKAGDVSDIKMSARIYRQEMQKIKMDKQFPVAAFNDEELDEEKFLAHCADHQKKMALAKFDFLDAVYASLNDEQKKQFLKEMTSVVNMKKFGGYGMRPGACGKPGMGMGPAACDGKGPRR